VCRTLRILLLSAVPVAGMACTPPPTNFAEFPPTYSAVWVDEKFPQLPAIQIQSVDIRRTAAAKPGLCGYQSIMTIRLYWPASRPFPLEQMGFYIRITNGNLPSGLFRREPVTVVHAEGPRADIRVSWQDDPVTKQKPLSFTLELIPIDRWLHLGPPTIKKVP
jgi:hypothetical protein